jgi:alginate O-acetyltransferase complex protein AlgI
MLFNSIEFALFLPVVFVIYWLIGNHRITTQNMFLLVASYVFYGWWDYRFLALIAFSSVIDYGIGLVMHQAKKDSKRKALLAVSICVNLGLLGFFKYYNFFVDNFVSAFTFFGQTPNIKTLKIILPVGISFYTFQTLSYTIDVYRRKLDPTRDIIGFFAFVSFFPQLVAGPIERATNLLPQFFVKREFTFEQGRDGLRQILWGLFKKIVVADTCAIFANDIFSGHQDYGSATLLIGALCFTFQIYGDFSGYSDIAIGTAKLFGFRLMTNFKYPYFSRDIAEFWRRWHVSLSSWFRDYVYIPLGGSNGTRRRTLLNVMIIFVVSGFWHGANWTFVVWGALNALYFVPLLITGKNRQNLDIVAQDSYWPSFREFFQVLITFGLTVLAWIFFRAENVGQAWDYLIQLLSLKPGKFYGGDYLPLAAVMLIWEWSMRHHAHALDLPDRLPRWVRWSMYFVLVWMILFFFGEEQAFIYFQF